MIACLQVDLEVTLPSDSAVERQFKVSIKWVCQVSLSLLDEAMEGRIRTVPFEAVQAMDVILRHLPSLRYVLSSHVNSTKLNCSSYGKLLRGSISSYKERL